MSAPCDGPMGALEGYKKLVLAHPSALSMVERGCRALSFLLPGGASFTAEGLWRGGAGGHTHPGMGFMYQKVNLIRLQSLRSWAFL